MSTLNANMKRVPLPSQIPGCSSTTWKKFVNKLTPTETASLYNAITDPDFDLAVEHCVSMRTKLVQSGFNQERFYSNLDATEIIPLALLTIDIAGDDTPAPRLVGIETNPGPTKNNNKKKAKVTTVSTVVRKTNPINNPPRILRPTIRRPHNVVTSSGANSFVRAFASAIEDPWESGPMKLGYDCFEDTVLGTAFSRGSITVNADGSFALMCSPNTGETVFTQNAGSNTATWATVQSSNATALSNQMSEARVTSGGIRVIALFPETSAPGVLFAGTLPSTSRTNMISYTPTTLGLVSSTEIGIGSKGARACILPQDNDSFSFTTGVLTPYVGTTIIPSSVPYIAGTGFPASTVIWYEAVVNLEGLINVGVSGVGSSPTSTLNDINTAANWFATPERLWSAARSILGHTVVMDATQGLISMASPSAGRMVNSIRSSFGSGHNLRTALVAGSQVRRNARQNTVMIEEMKEGYHLM